MRGVRSLSIASTLALFGQIVSTVPFAATTRAVELGTTQRPGEHGLWLPLVLVIALAVMTLPALAPRRFGRSRRGLHG